MPKMIDRKVTTMWSGKRPPCCSIAQPCKFDSRAPFVPPAFSAWCRAGKAVHRPMQRSPRSAWTWGGPRACNRRAIASAICTFRVLAAFSPDLQAPHCRAGGCAGAWRHHSGSCAAHAQVQSEHQPIKVRRRSLAPSGEKPVHRWRQPHDRQPFRQCSGRSRCPVDPDDSAIRRSVAQAVPAPRSTSPSRPTIAQILPARRCVPSRKVPPLSHIRALGFASRILVLPAPFSPVRTG